ncbi:unnamed protein product [Brassica rapa]|uniref:Uncharacterized protein n=1 Tax=Brassica campestris TaxID=3711 RepID=A0A8D9DG94_BRACM|nr:unnamed protein product [Brassica rapa]
MFRSAFEILETEVKGYTDPNHKLKIKWLVKMDHMVAALAKTFKCPVVDTIQALPQHQQVVVCSAAKAFRGSKKDRTIEESQSGLAQGILKLSQPQKSER